MEDVVGDAPSRPWDPDVLQLPQYWDYSGGSAPTLPSGALNIAWGEAQFPHKVMAEAGRTTPDQGPEVPDTSPDVGITKGHSLVLSQMANDTHVPAGPRQRGTS